jgi:hypothetical protein
MTKQKPNLNYNWVTKLYFVVAVKFGGQFGKFGVFCFLEAIVSLG